MKNTRDAKIQKRVLKQPTHCCNYNIILVQRTARNVFRELNVIFNNECKLIEDKIAFIFSVNKNNFDLIIYDNQIEWQRIDAFTKPYIYIYTYYMYYNLLSTFEQKKLL